MRNSQNYLSKNKNKQFISNKMLTHNESPEAFASNPNSALMYWLERPFPSVVTRGQYLAAMPRYGKQTGLIGVRCVPGLCSSNTVAKRAATTRVQLLLAGPRWR